MIARAALKAACAGATRRPAPTVVIFVVLAVGSAAVLLGLASAASSSYVATAPGTNLFMAAFAVVVLVMAVRIIASVVAAAVVAGHRRIAVLRSVGFTPAQATARSPGTIAVDESFTRSVFGATADRRIDRRPDVRRQQILPYRSKIGSSGHLPSIFSGTRPGYTPCDRGSGSSRAGPATGAARPGRAVCGGARLRKHFGPSRHRDRQEGVNE